MLLFLTAFNENEQNKIYSIFERYKNYMFVIAYDILRNKEDAEDVISEAIIKISNNLNKIENIQDNKTKSFIGIITKNTALDLYRKNKPRDNKDLSFMGIVPDFTQNIEDKESYRIIVNEINNLDSKYKDVLILRYVNELSDDKIGKILGISKDLVRKRAQRGRRKIMNKVQEGSRYE